MKTDANHAEFHGPRILSCLDDEVWLRFVRVDDHDWRLLEETGVPHLHSLESWTSPGAAVVRRDELLDAWLTLRSRRLAVRRGDCSALREDWTPPDYHPIEYRQVGYVAHTPVSGLGLLFFAGWSVAGSGFIKEHFIQGTT